MIISTYPTGHPNVVAAIRSSSSRDSQPTSPGVGVCVYVCVCVFVFVFVCVCLCVCVYCRIKVKYVSVYKIFAQSLFICIKTYVFKLVYVFDIHCAYDAISFSGLMLLMGNV